MNSHNHKQKITKEAKSFNPQAKVSYNRINNHIYPVQQDTLHTSSSYHFIMERIERVRCGFAQRLFDLRVAKGVSAREMSLALSQGSGYISNLENGHNLPSMSQFFAICEYLNVTPSEFFAYDEPTESKRVELQVLIKSLDPNDAQILLALARRLKRKE